MQLTTERLGQPPARPSVVLPTAAYVYDIAHRSGLCIGTIKVDDVSAVSAFENCPVATGAVVVSATGGDIVGYDMYGQMMAVTLGAGIAGAAAFARVTSGPADILYANTFGLPYKWLSGGTGDGGTYAGPEPIAGDPRGTFTPASVTEPADIQLNYTVDQTDTFGNIAGKFATADRVDPVAMTSTIDSAGLVTVNTTLVGDSSTTLSFLMPDGVTLTVANGIGAPTYQLPELYIQQYGASLNQMPVMDIISGVSAHGTRIDVTTTASIGQTGGNTLPEPDITGPYMTGGTQYWVNKATCKIGFDVDSDPDPEAWYTMQEIDDNDDISQESKDAYRASLAAVGCT